MDGKQRKNCKRVKFSSSMIGKQQTRSKLYKARIINIILFRNMNTNIQKKRFKIVDNVNREQGRE